MATSKEATQHDNMALPAIEAPKGDLDINLSAQYPIYRGGDARTEKPGYEGRPIHGLLLGTLSLPSTIPDPKTGELKDWEIFVIQLKQAVMVQEPGENGKIRVATPGEKIGFTVSTAAMRYMDYANDPKLVFEVFVKPVVAKTKKSNQKIWVYPEFRIINQFARTTEHAVGQQSLLTAPPVHQQLGSNGSSVQAAPFS